MIKTSFGMPWFAGRAATSSTMTPLASRNFALLLPFPARAITLAPPHSRTCLKPPDKNLADPNKTKVSPARNIFSPFLGPHNSTDRFISTGNPAFTLSSTQDLFTTGLPTLRAKRTLRVLVLSFATTTTSLTSSLARSRVSKTLPPLDSTSSQILALWVLVKPVNRKKRPRRAPSLGMGRSRLTRTAHVFETWGAGVSPDFRRSWAAIFAGLHCRQPLGLFRHRPQPNWAASPLPPSSHSAEGLPAARFSCPLSASISSLSLLFSFLSLLFSFLRPSSSGFEHRGRMQAPVSDGGVAYLGFLRLFRPPSMMWEASTADEAKNRRHSSEDLPATFLALSLASSSASGASSTVSSTATAAAGSGSGSGS
mmetsp:Transcript_3023/g.10417  ORF Transcript_3023/g.10417 Transcript_3023/m.10417 type:complete len:367 (+) Transcript_3023:767-1867(+)